MSFFGLTAFGPENFIRSSLVDSNGFTLYTDEDFKKGFDKLNKLKNTNGILQVSEKEVKIFLRLTFNFTPLDEEVREFISHSGKFEESQFLNWEEVVETLKNIRENLKLVSNKSKKYTSHKQYTDDMFKHRRKEVAPNETFKIPVTFGQNYGFNKFLERDLNDVRYPKKKCDETKYAESIIMSGRQFMK